MKKKILVYGKKPGIQKITGFLSQLSLEFEPASESQELVRKAKVFHPDLLLVDSDAKNPKENLFPPKVGQFLRASQLKWIILSGQSDPSAAREAQRLGASSFIFKPYNIREFMVRLNAVLQKKKRITCLGGGTGLFTILLGLKKIPNILLTSIVNMSDDGGSSGRLRASFGMLPPGDIRRSLVALSNAPELMNQVMQYRFKKGDELQDHSFGNLFLAALTEIKGSTAEAVRTLGDILNIQGMVLPVTNTLTRLVAEFEDGKVIQGESRIDRAEGRDPSLRLTQLWHEPESECNPDAFASILDSDFVILGPGDLFTSVISNLCVKGVREALLETKAQKIYLCNLMTKPGETAGFNALDHVREIIKYLGKEGLDIVLLSNTRFSNRSISEYAKLNQAPVMKEEARAFRKITQARILEADLANQHQLVRHDSEKVRIEIQKLIAHR